MKKSLLYFRQPFTNSNELSKRAKELLQSEDLTQVVSHLPALDIYFMVKELGTIDAAPILRACSASQLQAFVDLDCWNKDLFKPSALTKWLQPFAGLSPQAEVAAFLAIENEIQTLYFAQELLIISIEEKEDSLPPLASEPGSWVTPDRFFVVAPKSSAGDSDGPELIRLLQSLYKFVPNEAYKIIQSSIWELQSSTEEQAYQFKTGRLEEMGFPNSESSLGLFSAPHKQDNTNRGAAFSPLDTQGLATSYALPSGPDLLSLGIAAIEAPNLRKHFQIQLLNIANGLVVGFGESPKDFDTAKSYLDYAVATISLGLEQKLSPNQAMVDAHRTSVIDSVLPILETETLANLFRLGFKEIRNLQSIVQKYMADPIADSWLKRVPQNELSSSAEDLDRAFIHAIGHKRPEQGGYDLSKPRKTKPIYQKVELEEATNRFERIRSALVS